MGWALEIWIGGWRAESILLRWLRAYEFICREYNAHVSPLFATTWDACLRRANVDDLQEMHGKSNRTTPCEDEKPAAAATAEVEEPITAEAEDE